MSTSNILRCTGNRGEKDKGPLPGGADEVRIDCTVYFIYLIIVTDLSFIYCSAISVSYQIITH